MKVAGRIGREALVQVLGFAVQLADRLLIAALLLRTWGVDQFAAWSLVLAAGGMVALFDFGVNLYFANRVLFLVQQRREAEARTMLNAGNLLMVAASAIGLVAVAIGFGFVERSDGVRVTTELWLAAALVAGAMFARAATTIQMSVYRAHELYARQSLLWIGSDLARLVVTGAVVLLGGSILAAAAAICAVSILFHGATIFIDSRRQFPAFPFRFGPLPATVRREATKLSLGFWIQSAPNTALTFLPILLITGVGSGAMVTQFVLMRTLANFIRAGFQPFAVIFGQESARRVALQDAGGTRSTYREAAFLLAVMGAVPAGLLLALGPALFSLWTGHPDLFSQAMLVLAIAPPLLLPTLALSQAFLATVNDPWPIAHARIVQVVLTLAAYLLLPIEGAGMRMMAALALGELVGFGLWMTHRILRAIPGTGIRFHIEMLVRMTVALALTYVGARVGQSLFVAPWLATGAGLVAGGAAGTIGFALAGLTAQRRRAVMSFARAKWARG